ncbi:Sucrose transport protein SUC2 [Bienertia sinuspersici]
MNRNQIEEWQNGPGSPYWKLFLVASIAAGVQFGWALQLSLLTPYVQLLGVPHTWASFIWLCGPISGMVVQPIVGYSSDRLVTRLGRRKPFIAVGTVMICIAVAVIGFAADIGLMLGDSINQTTRPRAVAFFVSGFWILDIANNMVQDPARAFMADLAKHNHRKMRIANAFFSFFMAIGNILGYAAGSYDHLYKFLPFTLSHGCDIYCANLKTCFLIDIMFLVILVTCALFTVSEPPFEKSSDHEDPFLVQVKSTISNLGRPMWLLFLVTAMNWIAWFPFLLFNTDWVGNEIYGGKAAGLEAQKKMYDDGVRLGSVGLILTACSLGLMSLAIDPLSKVLGGARRLWGVVNFVLATALALTALITKSAEKARKSAQPGTPPPKSVKAGTLALFAALGIPQAIFVSLISGPWDQLFGGGNLPAFLLGAVAAFIDGILAFTVLPPPSSNT